MWDLSYQRVEKMMCKNHFNSIFVILFLCCFPYISHATLNGNMSNSSLPADTEVTSSPPAVRCYCNLPECVQRGYMCKSSQGVCFSKYLHRPNPLEIPDRGCLELLPENQRILCKRKARYQTQNESEIFGPYFDCCPMNVCNFGTTPPTAQPKQDRATPVTNTKSDWFKVLTISVPIIGGVILIALIMCAAKMLCQDSKQKESYHGIPSRSYSNTFIQQKNISPTMPFVNGVFNAGISSSTIYSKDFVDSMEESLPLNSPFHGHSI